MAGFNFKEFENKLVKHYWSDCMVNGRVDLDLVDGSDDFSIIPTNSKGKVQLEVGELRDIISFVITETRRDAYDALQKD